MNVEKRQSEIRDKVEESEISAYNYWSRSMMETGLVVHNYFEDDEGGVKICLGNAARYVLLSSIAADVELEGEVEEVESYDNIDTETIMFMLISDMAKLGQAAINPDSAVELNEVAYLNCMRDIAALEKSLDMDVESQIMDME